MHFTPVCLEDASRYQKLWEAAPLHPIGCSPANIWGWQEYCGIEWAFEDDLCWVRQTRPCDTVYCPPIGDWNKIQWRRKLEPGMRFAYVPEALASIWKEQLGEAVHAEETRDEWEYVYLREELATLPGKRFHKKKNHYLSYVKTYGEPLYRPLDPATVEDCFFLEGEWHRKNAYGRGELLAAEQNAFRRMLSERERFGLVGGALYIEGRIVAFSIGERLDASCAGVHFEKGLAEIRGVYQAVNVAFARSLPKECVYINRAEDCGEPGLRQAKESYHPVGYIKEFQAEIV